MVSDEDNARFTRRTVLRSTAVSASFGLIGSAAAADAEEFGKSPEVRESAHSQLLAKYDPADVVTDVDPAERERVVAEYADPAAVETELADTAQPILDELADRGYLAEASLAPFDLETKYDDVLEPSDDRRGVATTAVVHDDVTTAHITATTESNGYDVGLYHQPHTDNTYALVETGEDRLVVHDFDGDVGTDADCSNNYYCADEVCCSCRHSYGVEEYYWEKKERCCLMADGSYTCNTTNNACPCEETGSPCCH